MDVFWWSVGTGAVVLSGGVGFATGHFFGPWWGVGAGAMALVVYAVAILWLLFHDLRITG